MKILIESLIFDENYPQIFIIHSFVMVFASLVEYAVVSYMNKKLAQRRERRRKQAEQQMPIEMSMYSQITPTPRPKLVRKSFLVFKNKFNHVTHCYANLINLF